MNFKEWLENQEDPRIQAAWQKHIKPQMIVYRGLRLCPDSINKKIRDVLLTPFKENYRFDHWTVDFNVAASAGRGTGLWTNGPNKGTACGLQNTFYIIVEAQITPQDVDKEEFARVVTGTGVSKSAGVDSYFEQELEIPVLKQAYNNIKLVSYSLKLPNGQFNKYNKPLAEVLKELGFPNNYPGQ